LKFERALAIAFGIAFAVTSLVGFIYTWRTDGNPNAYPVFIAFAIVGGTMIHGKAIWAK
jgi:hypothetical protein